MIQEAVFVAGEGLLAHPVTYLFHLQPGVADGHPGEAGGKKLVIIDCRLNATGDVGAWLDAIDTTATAVLMLCPDRSQLAEVAARFLTAPAMPPAALLIRSVPLDDGNLHHYVSALNYTATPGGGASASGKSRFAEEVGGELPEEHPTACACVDFATLGTVFVTPEAADAFKMRVEMAMDGRFAAEAQPQPPTGVKYVLSTFHSNFSFTYSGDGTSNTSAGSADFAWTVWGFLYQSSSENKQILYAYGTMNLAAGGLHSNDECDRGFGNTYFQGTLGAPSSFSSIDFAPSSGSGSWSDSLTIPISYKSPTGGYQIWNFDQSFSNSVSSWDVKSISSGNNLGAMWWMTSPCDGSNISDKWKDAFSTWGHVGDLTGASSGSLNVNSMSAWETSSLQSGGVYVPGNFGWQGARFWGSSCSPGMYWKINANWNYYYNWNPGFTVDFSSLQPS